MVKEISGRGGGLVLKPQRVRVFPTHRGSRMGSEMRPWNTNDPPGERSCPQLYPYTTTTIDRHTHAHIYTTLPQGKDYRKITKPQQTAQHPQTKPPPPRTTSQATNTTQCPNSPEETRSPVFPTRKSTPCTKVYRK